jgi:hypothetical protein
MSSKNHVETGFLTLSGIFGRLQGSVTQTLFRTFSDQRFKSVMKIYFLL